jgi:Carboxypeptidase regulatory-like domain
LLASFFCALNLSAQEKVTIEGSVLDDGTNLPVPGAKVTLCYLASPAQLDTSAYTEASGTFRLPIQEAGIYVVEASAPGFQDTRSAPPGIQVDEGALEPDAEPVVHKVTLRLTRSAAIQGLVRDGDSLKALSKLTVRALRVFWVRGKLQLNEERIAFTDDEGVFRLETLPAGHYLVEVSKHTADGGADKGSPKRYPILLWPGGNRDVKPIDLIAGSEFSTGTIEYSRVSLSRLHLKIAPATCPKDDADYQISIDQVVTGGFLNRQVVNLTCSTPLVIGALAPGRYRLQSMVRFATLIEPVEVKLEEETDTDLELKAIKPAPIAGRITCDCKTPITDGSYMQVSFETGETAMIIDVANDGGFKGPTIFAGTTRIDVKRLPPGMYVKQALYNGVDRGQFIPLSQDVPGWLEITLSDRPAGITGTVVRDGQPASGNYVIVARWPLVPDAQSPSYVTAEIDAAGSFKIVDLAPGTYRVASVDPVAWARRNEPDAVVSWLKSAREIKLSEDQISTIALEARLP